MIFSPPPERLTTRETLDEEVSYLDLVAQLIDIDPAEVIEARQALANEMAIRPEQYLPMQFEDLMALYQDRCDRQRYDWVNATEEVTMFASRTPDCAHVEEQYAKIDNYASCNRNWLEVTYAVKVLRRQNPSYVILLSEQQPVEVRVWDTIRNEWSNPDSEMQEEMLTDFFYESLRATATQLGRTREQRAIADEDAKAKLEYALYGGKKVVTTTE